MTTDILKEEIRINTELVHEGRWGMVEEIADGILYCRDEDGEEFEIYQDNADPILWYVYRGQQLHTFTILFGYLYTSKRVRLLVKWYIYRRFIYFLTRQSLNKKRGCPVFYCDLVSLLMLQQQQVSCHLFK